MPGSYFIVKLQSSSIVGQILVKTQRAGTVIQANIIGTSYIRI